VPPTLRVDELFQFFQGHGTRASIVLGEFGEVMGIVTMKDVLTFIFGELTTEIRGSEEYERSEHGHIVPGWMRLLDFYSLTNIDIDDPVMTTVGGLVLRLFGRLPKVGEAVDYEGYHFHVLGIDGLRISRVEVSKAALPATEAEPEPEPAGEGGMPLPATTADKATDDTANQAAGEGASRGKSKRKKRRKERPKQADGTAEPTDTAPDDDQGAGATEGPAARPRTDTAEEY